MASTSPKNSPPLTHGSPGRLTRGLGTLTATPLRISLAPHYPTRRQGANKKGMGITSASDVPFGRFSHVPRSYAPALMCAGLNCSLKNDNARPPSRAGGASSKRRGPSETLRPTRRRPDLRRELQRDDDGAVVEWYVLVRSHGEVGRIVHARPAARPGSSPIW